MILAAGPLACDVASRAALKPFGDVFPAENIRHHFAGQDDDRGVYAKELLIPAGWTLGSHEHHYDHLSILSRGIGRLTINGRSELIEGSRMIVVPKGTAHELYAITPCIWFCIHPTHETDPDKVDQVILKQAVECPGQ